MTTTELIELLKKHERGGATGRPREVMFEVDDRIIDTDGIEVTGSGDGLISELYLSLPSVQPPRWIPVTEALPKEEDCPMDCLVTRKSKFIGNYTDMAVCEKNGTWTHEDLVAIVLGDVNDGKSTGLISTRDDNIIAWMPLPEPWKGEEHEL